MSNYVIGLTGGVASGKSEVTRRFEAFGVAVADAWLDRILVVDVPRETQLARLLRRDGIGEALAEGMLAAQASRAQRLAIADDIVVNDGSLEDLDRHVAALHTQYLALAI